MWKEYSHGTYDGLKEELERTYGVFIDEEAIFSSNFYIQTRHLYDSHHVDSFRRFPRNLSSNVHDAECLLQAPETMEEKMRRVLSEACELTLSRVLKRTDEEDFDRLIYILHRDFVERDEIVKEKDDGSKYWLLGVEKELEIAKSMFLPKFVWVSQLISGFPELVQKMDDMSHSLYLALETVDMSQISNLLSEFLELIHTFLQLIGEKYCRVIGVGDSAVQEVVTHLTGTPKGFEHELSTLIENGVYTFDGEENPPASKTLGRLLVRDIARSINERGMVVYPTDAALNLLMLNDSIPDKNHYKKWLDENMVPMLSKIAASCKVEDEIYAVYVDTLVGSSELSFRSVKESTKNIAEDWYSKKLGRPLREFRAMYSLEREVVDVMLKLKDMCFELMGNLNDVTISPANSGAISIGISALKDLLLLFQKSLSLMQQGPKLGRKAAIQEPTLINNRQTETVKIGVRCLVRNMRDRFRDRDRFKDRLRMQNCASHTITLSVLRSMKSPFNPPNKPAGIYLLSGLDNAGKIKLLDDVAEHLTVSEAIPQLIHVDLSDKFWSPSLLFNSTPKSFCRNSSEPAFSVVEAVKRWPYCVIVFDNIEKVDDLVYSNLLKILDTGMLRCVDGAVVDFRSTTIIFVTDVGKKDLALGLFGYSHQYYAGCSKDGIQQDGARFRTELLRRLDDILCARSKSQGPMKFFRFSEIKAGPCFFPERGPKENKT